MWRSIAWFVSLAAASWISAAEAADAARNPTWPHWRGPGAQGHSDDTRVPLTWSETQNILWKTPLPGVGNSTPIVWGDRIFLTASTPDGDERYVVCIGASDGKLLWKQTASKGVPSGKSHAWNGYASPSCATDGKHVYAFFGTPGLFCYDFDGKLIWKHSFGIFAIATGWGVAASPVIVDDLVIENCDNDGPKALPAGVRMEDAAPAALVALDRLTGKVRWTTPRNQGRGYSTPLLLPTAGGRVDLVLNSPLGLWGYDPSTGSERWHVDRLAPNGQAHFGEPLPVASKELIYVESGRPGPCQGIRLPGDGNVTKTHLAWESTRKGHRDVSSPILFGDHVYAADNRGTLSCIDLKTGKELYNDRLGGGGKSLASPVAVRGKLLFLLDDGTTAVVEPGTTFKAVGRNRLGEGKQLDFIASPAIAAGRLFIRSQSHLYCIGEKK